MHDHKKVARSLPQTLLRFVGQPIKKRLHVLNDFRLLSNLIANQFEPPIPDLLKPKFIHHTRFLLMRLGSDILVTKTAEILTFPISRHLLPLDELFEVLGLRNKVI